MTAGSMPGPEVGPEVDADVQTGCPARVQTALAGFMFLPLLTNFSKGQIYKSDRQK